MWKNTVLLVPELFGIVLCIFEHFPVKLLFVPLTTIHWQLFLYIICLSVVVVKALSPTENKKN